LIRRLLHTLNIHPRAFWHSLLTYRRFLGIIKPELMRSREEELLTRLQSLDRRWTPASLKAPLGRRLVVVAPHPDDESIGPGGLLLAHRGQSQIHVINVFNGDAGGQLASTDWQSDPDYRAELVRVRRQEFAAATQMLGASSVEYLDLSDGDSDVSIQTSEKLGAAVREHRPDVVLLPWYLDGQRDHRVTNVLYAWSCRDLECMVLGYEIWTLCQPNAIFDIADLLEVKIRLVETYVTQLATVDYVEYVRGLAHTRAFLQGTGPRRAGAAEAYFALPNTDYCELVMSLYGKRDQLTSAGHLLA
jgi:LmbE family N-acetylglucosaminyl deacetylase